MVDSVSLLGEGNGCIVVASAASPIKSLNKPAAFMHQMFEKFYQQIYQFKLNANLEKQSSS